MKATDDLFQLVQSLSQSEKRYVNIFAAKHTIGEQNNYLKLFEILLSQKEYDEDEIKKAFQGTNFIKHLASEKVYLYRFILKSMRSFHSEKSVDNSLKEWMMDAYYLYDKRLYGQCIKLLDKAKKLAYQHERYYCIIEVLGLMKRISMERSSKDLIANIKNINDELVYVMGIYGNYLEFSYRQDQLFTLLRSKYSLRDAEQLAEADKIVSHVLFSDINHALSFSARNAYYFALGLYNQLKGNVAETNNCYKKIVELWESEPERIKEDTFRYKVALSNYLNTCQQTRQYSEFPKAIAKIRAIPSKSADEEAEVFQNIYYLELIYNMSLNRFDDAIALVPDIETGLKKYKSKVNKARELAFCYNVSMLYFVCGEAKKALDWTNKIINTDKTESRQDIQDFARVFQLVLHYELGNSDLLEYLLRSTLRYFQKNTTEFYFEIFVINKLRKLISGNPETTIEECMHQFREELIDMIHDTTLKKAVGMQEILLWLDSKMQQKPLAAVVTESQAVQESN